MKIDKLLENYRSNSSRLKLLENELYNIYAKKVFPEMVCVYRSPTFGDFLQKSNKFNSITENAAIQLEKCNEKIKAQIKKLTRDIHDLKNITSITEILIEGLDNQEKFVINSFYIQGLQWRLIPFEYQKVFNQHISPDALKRKRNRAMKKMKSILKLTMINSKIT